MASAFDLAALLERQLRVDTSHTGKLLLDRTLFQTRVTAGGSARAACELTLKRNSGRLILLA
jgi:hypothetical protein